MRILFLVLLVLFNSSMLRFFEESAGFLGLPDFVWESPDFRAMQLGEGLAGDETLEGDTVAALMLSHDFDLRKLKSANNIPLRFPMYRQAEFKKLASAYDTVFSDLKYFPIPLDMNLKTPDISYENGWMDKRTYGGERGHEGCDLMGDQMPRGYYPIVSMTDGIVEQVGWLSKGGWRIGIRAPSGAYFYYAHLERYDRTWSVGEVVSAGTILGYMGDSGYGEEGCVGQFPVHLHLGIYLKTDHYKELSVNPYWILRHMEKKRLTYRYGR